MQLQQQQQQQQQQKLHGIGIGTRALLMHCIGACNGPLSFFRSSIPRCFSDCVFGCVVDWSWSILPPRCFRANSKACAVQIHADAAKFYLLCHNPGDGTIASVHFGILAAYPDCTGLCHCQSNCKGGRAINCNCRPHITHSGNGRSQIPTMSPKSLLMFQMGQPLKLANPPTPHPKALAKCRMRYRLLC